MREIKIVIRKLRSTKGLLCLQSSRISRINASSNEIRYLIPVFFFKKQVRTSVFIFIQWNRFKFDLKDGFY